MMLRTLAGLAGVVLVLLAVVTHATLPPEFRLAHTMALVGASLAFVGTLIAVARRGAGIRLRALAGVAWAGAIALPAIAGVIISPTPVALGSGIGVGLVVGLVASVGGTWVAYGLRPKWFHPPTTAAMVGSTR